MTFKRTILILVFLFLITPVLAVEQKKKQEESDQQISGFSLAGYGEKGKKSWDLSGKSADIFTEVVKLQEVVGNLYGEEEDIKLSARKGDFNKTDGKVHLEDNVVITTSTGAKLTTDSLDWDRKNQLVTTSDPVNIQKDNMVTQATGAKGEPNLKKVALEKDVTVNINPVNPDQNGPEVDKEKIVITCDGPLEIDYDKNIATFNNNVKVERTNSVIYSDKMDVYFTSPGKTNAEPKDTNEGAKMPQIMGASKIDKIVARGNVKVVQGENVSYSEEAIYNASDRKIVLKGRPKLIIYSEKDLQDASFGN
jgi:LPS export ABC transporter protein LptC